MISHHERQKSSAALELASFPQLVLPIAFLFGSAMDLFSAARASYALQPLGNYSSPLFLPVLKSSVPLACKKPSTYTEYYTRIDHDIPLRVMKSIITGISAEPTLNELMIASIHVWQLFAVLKTTQFQGLGRVTGLSISSPLVLLCFVIFVHKCVTVNTFNQDFPSQSYHAKAKTWLLQR